MTSELPRRRRRSDLFATLALVCAALFFLRSCKVHYHHKDEGTGTGCEYRWNVPGNHTLDDDGNVVPIVPDE